MMIKQICTIFSLVLILSSCIEIIDDIKVNLDGSGTFKYNINLSSSRTKVNSIIALDSIDGRKIPSLDEIKNKVNLFEDLLINQEGITNVIIDKDFTQFIFKVQCDFKSINDLQKGLKNVISQISSDPKINAAKYNWLSSDSCKFNRMVPQVSTDQVSRIPQKDMDLLKNGTYISITRFNKEIEKVSNHNSKLSKDKKAVMVKTTPYVLTKNKNVLNNTITLKDLN